MFNEYDNLKELLEDVLEQDELFLLGAKMLKKSHQALRDVGFTEEQATAIIVSQGPLLKQS